MKLLLSLNKELRLVDWFKNKGIAEPNLIEYLDLVMLVLEKQKKITIE